MAITAELTALLKQVPGNDGDWYKGMKWDDAGKVCDGVLANAQQNIAGIIQSLKDIDDGKDFQPRYLLHILAAYVGSPDKAAAKGTMVDVLIAALNADFSKPVKGTVIRELQFLADKKAAKAIAPFLADADQNADAAKALLTFSGTTDLFLAALPKATERCRTTIIESLGSLGDPTALPALTEAATDKDDDTKVVAFWGLARLADPSSVDVMIKASDAPASWVRIQAGEACIRMAERLVAAGKKAEAAKIYQHLKETRTDPTEAYVKDLATRALGGPGGGF